MKPSELRMANEVDMYLSEKPDGILIKFNDLTKLNCFIDGPDGTPYEGGRFELEVIIGDNYPTSPPIVNFITKIWHPAVDPLNGNIFTSDTLYWPPILTIQNFLMTIRTWMTSIFDTNPLDFQIHNQAVSRRDVFDKTAEFWSIHYAGANKPLDNEYKQKVEELAEVLGDKDMAILQLSYNDWKRDEE